MPQEATAVIHPGAPTAPAITTPTAGDKKTTTLDQAATYTAPDHLTEKEPATHDIPAPLDAIALPPTAPAALTAQATAAVAALPNTSTSKPKNTNHLIHLQREPKYSSSSQPRTQLPREHFLLYLIAEHHHP